ncbi:hypothetical protein MIND_01070200 [Mycena indigotica]|uniref:Uncharacterized protein n=1 Tax=Mycena indigotica TaxID=2126181 RepID=A0A8H6S9H0_9AGAR|nr:uncharacterized protein MIND_01070200 [Mycena indigotica]KAF7295309.1 hypothetical protein MIND_01070200 [Mycena indigotica]
MPPLSERQLLGGIAHLASDAGKVIGALVGGPDGQKPPGPPTPGQGPPKPGSPPGPPPDKPPPPPAQPPKPDPPPPKPDPPATAASAAPTVNGDGDDGDRNGNSNHHQGKGGKHNGNDSNKDNNPSPTSTTQTPPSTQSQPQPVEGGEPERAPAPQSSSSAMNSIPSLNSSVPPASISTSNDPDFGIPTPPIVFPSPTASPLPASVSPVAAASRQSTNAGAIAGGVLGALILIALVVAGSIMFIRRRRNRTAPSAEFLTVHPPETPFRRLDSFQASEMRAYDDSRLATRDYY